MMALEDARPEEVNIDVLRETVLQQEESHDMPGLIGIHWHPLAGRDCCGLIEFSPGKRLDGP
jgi:hypothetical protein